MQKIILASRSPRRKQLLEWAEVSFEVRVLETEENYPEGLSLTETAIHIARNKALAVRTDLLKDMVISMRTILAADTIVVLHGKIIGKPVDRQDAIDILTALSGQHHQVITGVVILQDDHETAFADTTDVVFHSLTHEQIVFYVDKYEPYDKAGAYAIQEWIGVVGIKSVTGDFYNVMGLPISRVVLELANMNHI